MFVEEKTQGEPQPVKVGTLKLSEAIREGAKLRPPVTIGRFFADGCSCAVGAAYEIATGINNEREHVIVNFVAEHYSVPVSVVGETSAKFRNGRGLTREQCADWLESQGF